ncbi:NmrA/HSCARG family protein [Halorarius litoreus]|uniref:NmrA/HSCARG family protein n=1 Tax=Halorarius litoreus TaxID=2962676 RepID=UPI0020CC16CE|nr:NmrA/HSCARG family protein [Halorarius litoreus]
MMKVLVAGATGNQGGSVIDHLLSGDYGEYRVFGLTRDADGDRAQALAERGVTVVEGDLTDIDRMTTLCDGMDAVFAVTTFYERGTDAETDQGVSLADAANAASVKRFVYSSVGDADTAGLKHFESKARVEKRIQKLGFDYTIVRPVYFMQNFAYLHREELAGGQLAMPLRMDTTLALLDADDIGKTVAMALADPETFVGETITLAGDNLTLPEMVTAFSEALGTEITPYSLDVTEYRTVAGDEMADMYAWFEREGYGDHVTDEAREYGIDCTTLAEFLAESDIWQPTAPAA